MYYYILNPAAGDGAINQLQEKLRARLNQIQISGEFAKTTGPGEATKMTEAAIAKGYTTVVAVGGDGTVNEVMNGITKDNVALGIIPIGHTNRLAKHLGINNWQQACEVLAARRLINYSLMAAGQHYFLSSLKIGFESELDKQVETPGKTIRQRAKHLSTGWGQAQDYQTLTANIKVDDSYEMDCELFTLTIANQRFINPSADNKLVVSLSDKPSAIKRANYVWQLMRGQRPLEDSATSYFHANRLLLSTTPETGVRIDGKLASRTPIAVRLTDRQVRFICEKPPTGFKPESL